MFGWLPLNNASHVIPSNMKKMENLHFLNKIDKIVRDVSSARFYEPGKALRGSTVCNLQVASFSYILNCTFQTR